MATINKQYSFIWYGICTDTTQAGGGCTSFDLITEAEAAKIDTVWQIDGSGNAQAFVNGATGSQPFDSLECGYAYYIKLKDTETYDCEIPHAQLSSYGENAPAEFRITSDCTTGDGGPSVQASIGLGTCTETINISAEHESVVPGHEDAGSYETCQLDATGATFTPLVNHEISGIRFNLTEEGLLSYRIDDTSTVKTLAGTNINITAVAKEGFAFGENPDTLTVRVIGTIVAKSAFNVILGIDETLAEGYTNGAGANDATPTDTVVTEATEIASVAITINNDNHVEYSLDGTIWNSLSSSATTITDNFTNLQLRTKTGLSADLESEITFVATGNNATIISKTLTYTTTIGSYSISLSSNRTENVEENAEGVTHKFTITHTGLSNIDVALNVSGKYSMSKTSSITGTNETLNFTGGELDSGSIDFYIKLRSKDGTGIESVTITATGTPEIGSGSKSATATLSSNLIPHPTIDSITINTSGLNSTGGNVIASITTSNTGSYGAHHWHYTISNDGGDIASSTDIMVNSVSGGYDPATITDTNVIETPGTYTITAWIVNILGSHERVSEEKTQTFTIPTVTTSMNLSTSAIDRDIDVSKTIPSDTINITKENITDVSISTPTNWTATLSGDKNTITVTYKGTTTISAVTNVDEETLTVTGTKGKRSGTPGTTITKTVTLNATLYDDAEFVISGNKTVDMSRTYNGAKSGDSQIFTLTNKQNVSYTVSGAMDGWQVKVGNGSYSTGVGVLEGLSENDTFTFRHTGINAGTYPQRTITFMPLEGVKDGNLGDPSPNNVVITLNATIEKANPTVSSNCSSLPNIEIEAGSTSNADTNSETCSFTLENCTVSDTTGTQGIFSYKIASNVFTYWITDASSAVASSTETLDVSLTLDDSTNYEFASGQSPISVTMVGEVTASVIPENSSIALGNCPNDISQDASPTATQTSCQLTLVNAVCEEITETTNNGIKYSLSTTGLLTYEASDPESVGVHTHQVTITANTNDASASLFTGQSESATLNVTMTITVNEVVVADDLLWIGFQDGTNAHYTNWYELEETQAVPIGDPIDVTGAVGSWNGVIWNNVLVPQGVPNVEKILPDSDGTIAFQKTKHSCVHPLSPTTTLFGVLGANSKTLGEFTYTTSDELLNAMDGNVQIKRTTIPADFITTFEDTIKYELIGTIAPPYTTFSISSNDSAYSSEIGTLMNTNNVPYLQGVNITASPTRPSGALSATQQTKTFNSDLLNVFCNGCPPISGTESAPNNGVNLVIVQDQDGAVDSKSYNATSCPDGVGMVSTGTNWAGSNLMYSAGAKNDAGAVTKQTSIDINEIYFTTVGGTKLKLASGKLPDCE